MDCIGVESAVLMVAHPAKVARAFARTATKTGYAGPTKATLPSRRVQSGMSPQRAQKKKKKKKKKKK
eukprot:NODE_22319_length_713_cov_1.940273.p3 GENE.NODE_22319_length_713_cov_1.940273~~NODE_22319_length_713_cov_1.940273.p3  ORF type:complete len:67 (-),score=26.74 NODE_22319_length_713_cov_1.940273:138-338(-)